MGKWGGEDEKDPEKPALLGEIYERIKAASHLHLPLSQGGNPLHRGHEAKLMYEVLQEKTETLRRMRTASLVLEEPKYCERDHRVGPAAQREKIFTWHLTFCDNDGDIVRYCFTQHEGERIRCSVRKAECDVGSK